MLSERSVRRGLFLLAVPGFSLLHAQSRSSATSDVFRRYADHVVKIQVVETGSAAKAGIGSGFFVTPAGHIVTNYHVISKLINAPTRYRVEMIDSAGTARKATVMAIDVVHDLAILASGITPPAYFTLSPTTLSQGNRLFSLGHPRDLGLSIVEGTYNGLLLHTLYPRIHFTGSLNPGMSGGPTVDETGRVIGVNVSTAGNQISFLVPVDRALALLTSATQAVKPAAPSLAQVGKQLRGYQNEYLRSMFDSATKTITLGPFTVVTQPAPFFRCWADAVPARDLPYEKVRHTCATDDDIYLDDNQTTGTVTVNHLLLSTKTLNAPRFFALYSQNFGFDNAPPGEEEYVTSWKCRTRNVDNGGTKLRTVLCLRRYKKIGELYDGLLKVAVLGTRDVGLVSTLAMTGVSYENVAKVSQRYLGRIKWR